MDELKYGTYYYLNYCDKLLPRAATIILWLFSFHDVHHLFHCDDYSYLTIIITFLDHYYTIRADEDNSFDDGVLVALTVSFITEGS